MTDDAFTAQLVEVARQVVDETPGQQFATARRIHETLAREQRTRKHRIQVIALAFAGVCALAVVARYAGWQPDPSPDEAPVAVSPPTRAPAPLPVAPTPVAPAPPAPALSPTPAPVPAPAPVVVPAPAHPAPRPTAPQPVPAKRSAVPAPVRPEALRTEPATPAPAPEPARVADPGTERAAPAAPAAPPAPDASAELKSYSRAHDAYFHGGDPAAALAAWDAYLASYPSGQLVLEARYARALVLIKLQRWSEAADALRPFASAPAGSYRQVEAARLLAAMPGH